MDYQGNSKKSKTSNPETPVKKEPLDKVVTGEVVVKKRTISSRFKGIFLGGDFATAAEYVVAEVLLPAIRTLLVESVSRGADRLIYGDSGPRRTMGRPNYSPRVQYHNPAAARSAVTRTYLPDQRPIERWTPGRKTFEDVIVASKSDADTVVESLINVVDMYEVVSLSDLNELLGLPVSHIDHKWGWTNLATIEVRQVREGWQIAFPPLEEIA